MNIWRLCTGILSVVLFFFILIQSSVISIVNLSASGIVGTAVAFLILFAGILSIVLCTTYKSIAAFFLVIFFGTAAGLGGWWGYTHWEAFSDLVIYASWSAFCTVLAIVDFIRCYNEEKEDAILAEFEVQKPAPQYQLLTIVCPNCHAPIPANSKFCHFCRQEIYQKQHCANCGAVIDEKSKFCTNCGKAL